jgi:hypothetical protein
VSQSDALFRLPFWKGIVSMLSASRHLVLAITVVCAGCANPLNPEAGMAVPKDSGTVVARLSDQDGAPLRDVLVLVRDIPNALGSFYSVGQGTDAKGVMTIHGIPAGRRRVEVTLPAGYTAGPDGVVKEVDVVKGASVTVFFRLVRK